MKRFFFLLFQATLFLLSSAQTEGSRSALNPSLAPFYHGVASGDPLADKVIIWTRITLDPPVDPVTVNWQIATDTSFNNIVNSGSVTTDSTKDYTVKQDVTGLQQNRWYYYRFIYDTLKSVTGRTRTLPTGSVNNLRFAVASCQDYQKGYYNAHRHIAQRNDIDAVLFLGDYTYENGIDSVIQGRYHDPTHKTILLADYRIRQSLYRLDPDLQAAHQQYPWICVWDDHETANNSYKDGAKNHNPLTDGPWYDRKFNGVETYHEWMPVRVPDPSDTFKIFRRFTWGDLLDLNMLDTRLYDRDKQVTTSQFVPVNDSTIQDSTRNMMGPVQINWLEHNMDSSSAQWQILGQQVVMTPLIVPAGFVGPDAVIINSDQWDGYPFDREKLYNLILSHNIKNVVVLTGDIHTSWANDLPLPNYDSLHRQNSVGVEFVCTSISSSNDKLPPIVSESLIYSLAQHVRYVDLTYHGYYVLDITPARAQGDFVFVSGVTTKSFTKVVGPSWYVNDGETFLRQANNPSVAMNTYPALAEFPALNTSVNNLSDNITPVSIAPNPFYDEVLIQFNTVKPEHIIMKVYNSTGRVMLEETLGITTPGLNYATFNGSNFPSGFYSVELRGSGRSVGKAVIKVN